ncbi:MAG: hypothetical protein ACI870_000341 [Crocinitomicaceae bacterium]|jgi:hypothetical protein
MNLKKIIKIILIFVLFFSIGTFSYAETEIVDPGVGGTNIIDTGNDSNSFDKLQNPLQNSGIDDIPKLVRTILDIVLTIAVPIIAVAIIYTGFLFIAAQGNPEKLKVAKDTLLYVLIGAAVLLAAYVIAEAIESTVRAITG